MSRARFSLVALLALSLGACASESEESAESEESEISISELGRLIQTYNGVRGRRPFTGLDEAKRAAEVPGVDEACPTTDPICRDIARAESLEPAEARTAFAGVRSALRTRVEDAIRTGDLAKATASPAVRYWLRERVVALTAHYAIQNEPQTFLTGTSGSAPVTGASVDAFLGSYYPLYDKADDFALARAMLPPEQATECGSRKTAAVVVIPGVIRSTAKREFEGQMATVRAALPCIDFRRVDFGSFDDPDARIVPEVKKVVDQIDREDGQVPLHIVGYSQGVVVAMRTLAQHPSIGKRTRSVLAMNGAHHGSEAADFAIQLMEGIGKCKPWQLICKNLRSHGFKILTESLFHVSLAADEGNDRFEEVMARKMEGMSSLTTSYAKSFWDGPARAIPENAPGAVFFSFRSTITNTDEDPNRGNLPAEQIASFNLVWDRAHATGSPFNDMQVRLVNHALGGSVASREVVGRVAEGNHWQWQLTEAETDQHMESEMIRRMPRNSLFHAWYRSLAEIGLVGSQ